MDRCTAVTREHGEFSDFKKKIRAKIHTRIPLERLKLRNLRAKPPTCSASGSKNIESILYTR